MKVMFKASIVHGDVVAWQMCSLFSCRRSSSCTAGALFTESAVLHALTRTKQLHEDWDYCPHPFTVVGVGPMASGPGSLPAGRPGNAITRLRFDERLIDLRQVHKSTELKNYLVFKRCCLLDGQRITRSVAC